MRIEITRDFNDLEATDEKTLRVEAGAKMTVSAERGAELVRLGIGIEIDAATQKPVRAKRRKATSPATLAPTPAPAPAPAPTPAPVSSAAAPAKAEIPAS